MTKSSPRPQAHLRILSTTDVHTHLLPYDYFGDRDAGGSGLATAAALIHARRAQAANSLLLDNGDFLQGTPLAEVAPAGPAAPQHPAILAMNALGYDAATLGNHEFDFGLPALEAALAGALFPLVLANVRRRDGAPFVPPWTILARSLRLADGGEAPIRIGVIGFTPPQVADWDSAVLKGAIATEDILAAARRELPALRAAGADIVIALCHSGIGGAAPFPRMENAVVPLAAMDGIDVLIAGHTHQVFPGPPIPPSTHVDPERGTVHGKPTVMAGHNASHVGQIDLTLSQGPDGWQVTGHRVAALRVRPTATPDPAILDALAPYHDRAIAAFRKTISQGAQRIDSYFALVAPSSAVQVLADAQRRFVEGTAADLPDLPLLSAASASRSGGWGGPRNYVDIPAGPLSLGAAASLYPYPNPLCVVEASGRAVRDWLERSASLFRQIPEGARSEPLLSPEAAGYNFDVLDGLTYAIDLRAAPRFQADGSLWDEGASRIRDLAWRGQPVQDDDRFLVITNTFRTAGGGRFRAARAARMVLQTDVPTRDAVAAHLGATPRLSVTVRPTWTFAAHDSPTTVTFDTGPGAVDLPLPDTGRGTRYSGPAGDGFERFEIALGPRLAGGAPDPYT